MSQKASITIANRRVDIERAAELIETFGSSHGLSAEVIFKLNLALDEVVTNIIAYAFDDETDRQIDITVTLDDEIISIRVEDDGLAFNPLDAPVPDLKLGIDDRPIGGLGVHIVRSVMDALEYHRESGRNIFIMRKNAAGAG